MGCWSSFGSSRRGTEHRCSDRDGSPPTPDTKDVHACKTVPAQALGDVGSASFRVRRLRRTCDGSRQRITPPQTPLEPGVPSVGNLSTAAVGARDVVKQDVEWLCQGCCGSCVAASMLCQRFSAVENRINSGKQQQTNKHRISRRSKRRAGGA